MVKSKTHKTSLKLTELWQFAATAAIRGYNSSEDFDSSSYKTGASIERRTLVPSDFVMIEPSFLPTLTAGELKWAVTIMAELKRNNALWHFSYRKKGRVEGLISKLRDRNLLFKTDNISMHIVNPWLMRRGTIPATVAATSILVDGVSDLREEMVRDLKKPAAAIINGYYSNLV